MFCCYAPQHLKSVKTAQSPHSTHRPHDPRMDGPRPLGDFELGTRSRQNDKFFRNKADSGLAPGVHQDTLPRRDLKAERHTATVSKPKRCGSTKSFRRDVNVVYDRSA